MAELVLAQVSKTYAGNVLGVEDINLEIKDRELVVIFGPSGCGKTTTLRLIAGLEETTRGEIRIGGQVVNSWPPQDRDVAMVFQDYALYPHLTVFGNLAFGLRLRRRRLRLAAAEIERHVRVVADVLRLTKLLDRMPRQLSGGERQRVAFGRALVREPSIFLLDEPFSGLDLPLRVELRREILAVRERVSAPMLYVTHDQSEAASLGDRTMLMHRGRVQQVGHWQELYNRPVSKLVAELTGVPRMNFLDGRIVIEDGTAKFRTNAVTLPVPPAMRDCLREAVGRDLILGLRPESISCELVSGSVNTMRPVAHVESFECYGSGGHVRVRMNNETFVCRANELQRIERGEPVELMFDMTRCQVFDTTGRNVALGIEKSSPGG
jgi:multiple sugar transport system ATP-binding protein